MKTLSRLSLLAVSLLVAGQAAATSIDFRAETRSITHDHKYRFKMSDKIGNFNVGAELKFKSDSKEFMNNLVSDGSEIEVGYTHQYDNGWYLQPGMPITFGSSKTTYKPQLRVGYKFDTVPSYVALRYRHEINANVAADTSDDQKSKLTFTTGYKFENGLNINFEANYEQMAHNPNNAVLFDNGDSNYDYQVKVGYSIGQYTPYFDLTNVSVSSTSDQRQLRGRVGINYKF